jgi:prolyl oligopeptidase PreP (S9A serine peptidase family)
VNGGSNGGLLIGAVMTQRPDSIQVCFPEVGVLDMLRYQKFTAGFGWVPEYGNAGQQQGGVRLPDQVLPAAQREAREVPSHHGDDRRPR